MSKELYLYSPIVDFTAENLISQMEEEGNDQDITIRMSTGGGSVYAGWGIAAKMTERKGKTTIKVDGAAMSMGAALCLFADNVQCLDVSTFMLHRADMYVEDATEQDLLDKINSGIRAKMEAKIDSKKLKEIKGVSIKNLFEDDKRIDLFLTAKEAKDIGLVNKINKVDPKEVKAFNERLMQVTAKYTQPISEIIIEPKKIINMDILKFKAEFPALYAEVLALGVAQEKDRVESILIWSEVDPKMVSETIESGKELSAKQMSELVFKKNSPDILAKLAGAAAPAVTTATPEAIAKTEKEKNIESFTSELRAKVGLKK